MQFEKILVVDDMHIPSMEGYQAIEQILKILKKYNAIYGYLCLGSSEKLFTQGQQQRLKNMNLLDIILWNICQPHSLVK